MTQTAPTRSDSWIPKIFVGGMLLVVVVNAGLVYAALSTFAGTTVTRAYERGRGYNQVLAEAARQQALGWRAEVSLADARLRVHVTDREGAAVPGRLEGYMLRPLEGSTRPLSLQASAPGTWAAAAPDLAPGQWEARLVLHGPQGERLDVRARVMAP